MAHACAIWKEQLADLNAPNSRPHQKWASPCNSEYCSIVWLHHLNSNDEQSMGLSPEPLYPSVFSFSSMFTSDDELILQILAFLKR